MSDNPYDSHDELHNQTGSQETDYPEASEQPVIPEPPISGDDTPPSGIFRLQRDGNNPIIPEPPIVTEDTPPSSTYHREATQPIAIVRPVAAAKSSRSVLNWLMYGVAVVITLIAAAIYIQQGNTPAPQPTVPVAQVIATQPPPVQPTAQPTIPPVTASTALQPANVSDTSTDGGVPADAITELLLQAGDTAPAADQVYRMQTAYTIAPSRARSTVIQYTIHSGDTLDKIAAQYGIAGETLIWNNDGIYVNRLLPGDQLTILPTNGVLYTSKGQDTIQAIADKYKVTPYAIIDSEFNQLQNATPTTILPADMKIIVPGGQGTNQAAYWDPGVKVTNLGGAKPGDPIRGRPLVAVEFGGGPGSCGALASAGGTGTLRVPLQLGSYQISRGFSAIHSGIDLASHTGAAVFAADRGTVIFAGWSTYGYGNAIVISHGDKLTLYGHLSQINVGCGQVVNAGAVIGAEGSTGNSTGPHLHFEIRPLPGNQPVNPTSYMSF